MSYYTRIGKVYYATSAVEVCVLPPTHEDYRHHMLRIQRRKDGQYAILNPQGHSILNKEEEWDLDVSYSEREDGWEDNHYFSLVEAMEIAAKVVEKESREWLK